MNIDSITSKFISFKLFWIRVWFYICSKRMKYPVYLHADGFSVGDPVRKKKGMKFNGTILTIYRVPHEERFWCVVILDKNEASDHLQHLYPLELFEKRER